MRYLPVHWSEGMFLRPQHFQAADRSWNEKVATAVTALDPCSYGIVRLEINATALASRQLDVRACQARMRDGTLVWLEVGETPDRVSLQGATDEIAKLSAHLEEAMLTVDTVRVYLAVPRFDPVGSNVSPPGPADRSQSRRRFRTTPLAATIRRWSSGV
jgi:type VI secretion system protein ImpJ